MSGQVISGQVKSGQVQSGKVKSGQVKSEQVKSGQVKSGQVNSIQIKLRYVKSGQVKWEQVKSGQVRTGHGWKYFKSQSFWDPRFLTEPNIFPNSKIFREPNIFSDQIFLGQKIFQTKKDFVKKISDQKFLYTHYVFRSNVNYDANKINQNWYLMQLMHLRMEFDLAQLFFYFGWCLRATFISDISEKFTPPHAWFLKIPKLKLGYS